MRYILFNKIYGVHSQFANDHCYYSDDAHTNSYHYFIGGAVLVAAIYWAIYLRTEKSQ